MALAAFGLLWLARRRADTLAAVAGATVGLALVMIAPGNAARSAMLAPRMSIPLAFSITSASMFKYVVLQGQSFGLVYVAIGAVGALASRQRRMRHRARWIALIALGAFVAAVALIFPNVWAASAISPRVVTVVQATWIAAALAIGYVAGFSKKAALLALLILGVLMSARQTLTTIPALEQSAAHWDIDPQTSFLWNLAELEPPTTSWIADGVRQWQETQARSPRFFLPPA